MLRFYATWCAAGVKEQPELVRFVTSRIGRDGVLVGWVIYQDNCTAMRSLKWSYGGSWPVPSDQNGEAASAFEVIAVPCGFVANPANDVVTAVHGGVTATSLSAIIDANPLVRTGSLATSPAP